MSEIKEMKGYKAFDKDLKCRDFQYEVGKVYQEDSAILCHKGFHFCEDPISVLGYYNNRFAEISATDVAEETESDTKRVAKEIKIDSEISLDKLINAGIKFRFSKTDFEKTENKASGNKGAAQASGNKGAAQASGYNGAAQASGYKGVAQASGDNGAAQASGY
jgi:hypothetical protein